jgi:hypothetical protein
MTSDSQHPVIRVRLNVGLPRVLPGVHRVIETNMNKTGMTASGSWVHARRGWGSPMSPLPAV